MGETNKVNITFVKNINKTELREQLIQYERLTDWDSLYLLILKLISIFQEEIDNKLKFKRLIEWMMNKFRLSNIIIVYSIILLFSPLSKMIKYRKADSKEKKLQAVKNMTWDIYIMDRFLKLWQYKANEEEIIFASNDNVIKKILQIAIRVNINASWEPLKDYISEKDYTFLQHTLNMTDSITNRIYGTDKWTRLYRQDLIKELEDELL